MYLVKALRLFVGTNSERTAAGLGAFLPGDEYHETDTDNTFQNDGMAWIQKNTVTTPAGTDGQIQYNNGGTLGGFGLWNDVSNQLLIGNSTPAFAGTVAEFHDAATAASIAIVNDTASADANIAATSYYLKNTSELQTAFGYFSVGSVTRTNGSEDGYFDISVMRGGTLTSMLDIRPSVITLNPGAGDTDMRISGNGVTNGYFYDAGNNRHGFNTGAPASTVHIVGDTTIEAASQNYLMTGRADRLAFVAQSAGNNAGMEFFPFDGDGTDNIAITVFGVGSVADITNRERLFLNYSPATAFQIYSEAAGTGTLQPIRIGMSTITTQLELQTNGNVSLGATTGMLIANRLTTTQQNATTPIDGMIYYNTTINKFRGRAGGAWIDLH